MSDPRRFIGRKASPCKKCSGIGFYVNRMGGVVCLTCSPPRSEADNCQVLTIEGGVWIDPHDRFDMVDVPFEQAAQVLAQSKATSSQVRAGSEATKEAVGLRRARHTRGPDGEYSDAEIELFGSQEIWDLPAHIDLIVTYNAIAVIGASEMFSASETAELRLRGRDATPGTLNTKKERTAATSATASMFSV